MRRIQQGFPYGCIRLEILYRVITVDGSEIPNNHLGCIKPCKKKYNLHPPVNSGGALVPPHFIDINRGGTGPPCKATSIEWGCTGCLTPFSL